MRVASPKTTPECTQRAKGWIRSALTRLYTPWGYAGDEDNGEMAAWYLLSASGLYPLTLGSDQFVLGAPLFKHLEVTVGEPPRKLSITTRRRAVFGEGGVDALWRSSMGRVGGVDALWRPRYVTEAVFIIVKVAITYQTVGIIMIVFILIIQDAEFDPLPEDADYDPVPEVRKVLADLRGGRQVLRQLLRDRAAVRKRVVQRAEMAAKAKRASNQPLVRSAQFQMVKNKMAARDAMWVRNSAPNQRTLGGPRLASVRPT
ncbi:glycosyl hydrolase family 92-domain-containing protein [Pavlovales sp. CCMP2436]|nr:glycosyl hydrolase family 92-domain-containing protein [Pavlovales sp. CCMP2436]